MLTLPVASATQVLVARSGTPDGYDVRVIRDIAASVVGTVPYAFTALVAALTVSTFLMVVGAVVRLVRAWDGAPLVALRRSPLRVQALITCAHAMVWGLATVFDGSLARMVALANVFFIANMVPGLAAARKVLRTPVSRAVAGELGLFCVAVATLSRHC